LNEVSAWWCSVGEEKPFCFYSFFLVFCVFFIFDEMGEFIIRWSSIIGFRFPHFCFTKSRSTQRWLSSLEAFEVQAL